MAARVFSLTELTVAVPYEAKEQQFCAPSNRKGWLYGFAFIARCDEDPARFTSFYQEMWDDLLASITAAKQVPVTERPMLAVDESGKKFVHYRSDDGVTTGVDPALARLLVGLRVVRLMGRDALHNQASRRRPEWFCLGGVDDTDSVVIAVMPVKKAGH